MEKHDIKKTGFITFEEFRSVFRNASEPSLTPETNQTPPRP